MTTVIFPSGPCRWPRCCSVAVQPHHEQEVLTLNRGLGTAIIITWTFCWLISPCGRYFYLKFSVLRIVDAFVSTPRASCEVSSAHCSLLVFRPIHLTRWPYHTCWPNGSKVLSSYPESNLLLMLN